MKKNILSLIPFLLISLIFNCGKTDFNSPPSDITMNIRFSPAVSENLKLGNKYELNLVISRYSTKLNEENKEFTFGESNIFDFEYEYDFDGEVTISLGIYYTPPDGSGSRENVGSAERTITLLRGQTVTADLTVTISEDHPPVAEAGDNDTVAIGYPATLDGSKSSDQDGDALYYFWILISAPSGFNQSVISPYVSFSFTPSVKGEYKFLLYAYETKNNTKLDTDTVIITANSLGEISGYVKDKITGLPIEGAQVGLIGTTYNATSDTNGYYEIEDIVPGTYDIAAVKENYLVGFLVNVEIQIGPNSDLNITYNE